MQADPRRARRPCHGNAIDMCRSINRNYLNLRMM